jgi:hypothetical protein
MPSMGLVTVVQRGLGLFQGGARFVHLRLRGARSQQLFGPPKGGLRLRQRRLGRAYLGLGAFQVCLVGGRVDAEHRRARFKCGAGLVQDFRHQPADPGANRRFGLRHCATGKRQDARHQLGLHLDHADLGRGRLILLRLGRQGQKPQGKKGNAYHWADSGHRMIPLERAPERQCLVALLHDHAQCAIFA